MRTDFDSRAVQRAMLREGVSLVVQSLLYPFGYLRSRHQPERKRDIRTVVFVHGLAANRATFYPLQWYLRTKGHARQLSVNHASRGSIESLAIGLKRQIDEQVKGGRIDIVGHSLGGLIARFYLQELGGARRVDRLITLGTPHAGTYASQFIPSAFVQQLKPDGPFIQHLNRGPLPEGLQMLSITGDSDALLLPRDAAHTDLGETLVLQGVGHTGLLISPAVFGAVGRALR